MRQSKPICDHFYWRRIIMDEVHEKISDYRCMNLLPLHSASFYVDCFLKLLFSYLFLLSPSFSCFNYFYESTSERTTIKIQMGSQRNSVLNDVHSSLLPLPYPSSPSFSAPSPALSFIYLSCYFLQQCDVSNCKDLSKSRAKVITREID